MGGEIRLNANAGLPSLPFRQEPEDGATDVSYNAYGAGLEISPYDFLKSDAFLSPSFRLGLGVITPSLKAKDGTYPEEPRLALHYQEALVGVRGSRSLYPNIRLTGALYAGATHIENPAATCELKTDRHGEIDQLSCGDPPDRGALGGFAFPYSTNNSQLESIGFTAIGSTGISLKIWRGFSGNLELGAQILSLPNDGKTQWMLIPKASAGLGFAW